MILCYEIFIASSEATRAAETAAKLARSSGIGRNVQWANQKTLLADIRFINPENSHYWIMHFRRFFARVANFIPRS